MKHPVAWVDGALRSIHEVAAGTVGKCVLTGQKLVAKAVESTQVSPHFSYVGGGGYGGGGITFGETEWHILAKSIVETGASLSLPGSEIIEYASASAEVDVPGTSRRADAQVRPSGLFVEFLYSHRKGGEERADFRRARARCVEIDIRSLGRRPMTGDEIVEFVLHSAPRQWVFDMETAVREVWVEVLRRREERARKRREAEDRARREIDAVKLEGRAVASDLEAKSALSTAGRLSFISAAQSFRLAATHLRRGHLRAHNEAFRAAQHTHDRAVEAELYDARVRAVLEEEQEARDAAAQVNREAEIRAAAALEAWKKNADEKRARKIAVFAGKADMARSVADRHGGKVRDAILKGAECCDRVTEELASWKRKDEAAYWEKAVETAGVTARELLRQHAAAVADAENEVTLTGLRGCVLRMTDTVPEAIAERIATMEEENRSRSETLQRERESVAREQRDAAERLAKATEAAAKIAREEREAEQLRLRTEQEAAARAADAALRERLAALNVALTDSNARYLARYAAELAGVGGA